MRKTTTRPELLLDIRALGRVNPFRLRLIEEPPSSGQFYMKADAGQVPLDMAGLAVVGAAQALFTLSARWLARAGRGVDPEALPPPGEVRVLLKRREARLLAALVRRHLTRLEQAPPWMTDLRQTMEQIDEFLRWEDPG